jgi:DNA-binding Lrp family transcriptional regulator
MNSPKSEKFGKDGRALERIVMTVPSAADRNIIRLLRLNARMSTSAIAKEVGLSASTCSRRIRMLEDSGVIRGYTALIDHVTREAGMAVIINITLERQTEDYLKRFEAVVRRNPEIQECYLMTGGSDYLLRVEVENAAEFERIHTEILSTLPGVARIHSSFSIRNVLSTRRRHK